MREAPGWEPHQESGDQSHPGDVVEGACPGPGEQEHAVQGPPQGAGSDPSHPPPLPQKARPPLGCSKGLKGQLW